MADKTKIEWTDATWTPIRARNRKTGKLGWHCEHVSPGCANCYAEDFNQRLGTGLPFKPGHLADVELFLDEAMLTQPLRWKKPRMIFVCSMTDLFADFVPDAMIDRIFAVMALCPQHFFQVLTKRPKRMREYCSTIQKNGRWLAMEDVAIRLGFEPRGRHDYGFDFVSHKQFLPNVWLGTSVEDQPRADERIPDLLMTPAAVRFVSAEPLLGAIDITPYLFIYTHADDAALAADSGPPPILPFHDPSTTKPEDIATPPLDWIIAGGESGREARSCLKAWKTSLRDQCAAAGVAFFFKQWGDWIDADEWLAGIARNGAIAIGGLDLRHGPPPPLNFGQAAEVAKACGLRFEHQSDGSTMLRVGKSRAGRLLDGDEHNAFPEAPR